MKKALLYTSCLIMLLFAVCQQALATPTTVLRYKISNGGKEIGEIKAQRIQRGNQVVFEMETKMTIRIILKQHVLANVQAVYQNGILQSSSAQTLVNGDVHNKCIVVKKANTYEVTRDDKLQKVIGAISYSGVMIYFTEPNGNTPVFSEMNAHKAEMQKISTQHYKLHDPKKGKDNLYWYKGGILQKAKLYHALLDIEIERVL